MAVESPLFRCVALCSEFPNDNPSLYGGRVHGERAVEPVEVQAEAGTDPTPPVLEADDPVDDIDLELEEGGALDEIEIVDELVIEDAVEEVRSVPAPRTPDDPFDALVAVLEDVARAAGASDAAMHTLRGLLGRERLAADAAAEHSSLRAAAAAWGAILRNESEDFSACGPSTLDEWSSTVIASALGEPARADLLRRELRRRGVAAFGLVVEAA